MNEDYKLIRTLRIDSMFFYTTKDIEREELIEILKKRLGFFEKYLLLAKEQKGLLEFILKLRSSADQKVCKLFLVKLISDFTNQTFIGEEGENIFMNELYCIKNYKGVVRNMAIKRITVANLNQAKEVCQDVMMFNKTIERIVEIIKEKGSEVKQPTEQ